jgi:signal peptidase I
MHPGTRLQTDCTPEPCIPVDDVVGKVFVLLWPHDRFHVLHRPGDFAGVPAPAATTGSGTTRQ